METKDVSGGTVVGPTQSAPVPESALPKLDEAGWVHWTKFHQMQLWHAVAITLGYDPAQVPPDSITSGEIGKRVLLAESDFGVGDAYKVITPDATAAGRVFRSLVSFQSFVHWAMAQDLEMPEPLKQWYLTSGRR